jgi:nitric oxide reductase NorE protein
LSSRARRWQPLTGGTAIWVFMAVEVLTFGLFLLHHAWGWAGSAEVMAEGRARLHVDSATLGTVVLLLGSWAAYEGVLACEEGRGRPGALWFLGTAASGLVFTVNKIGEYASPELAGISLSESRFWFSYLFLTGLHLAHVVLGIGGFLWLAGQAWRARSGEGEGLLAVQAGAAYWHLIDVVWLLLFPVLYLMSP